MKFVRSAGSLRMAGGLSRSGFGVRAFGTVQPPPWESQSGGYAVGDEGCKSRQDEGQNTRHSST
eukprot:1341148-Amorphochlora_amoeboformis.AAC.1